MNNHTLARVRASAGRQVARVLLWLSLMGSAAGGLLSAFYDASTSFLDQRMFPTVIRFATHPYVIFCTMLLIVPLIAFADVTKFELIGGNWTNVVSASVSSIVLMQSMRHHTANKAMHADAAAQRQAHQSELAALRSEVAALIARLDGAQSASSASSSTPVPAPVPALTQRRPKRTLVTAATIPAQKSSEVSA